MVQAEEMVHRPLMEQLGVQGGGWPGWVEQKEKRVVGGPDHGGHQRSRSQVGILGCDGRVVEEFQAGE